MTSNRLTKNIWRMSLVFAGILFAGFSGCGGSGDGTASPSSSEGSTTEMTGTAESGSGTISLPPNEGSASSTGQESAGTMELPDIPETPEQSTPASEGGSFELPDVDQSSKSAGPKLELKYASWSAITRHATTTGKITVVDLWSTMCHPCIKEFPGLVRLDQTLHDKVACIGVDVDYDGRKKRPPESYAETVEAFLSSVGATFDNYICETPSDDLFKEIGLPSIPAVLVFDKDGKLVKQFVDSGETLGFTYDDDVIPLVESIL